MMSETLSFPGLGLEFELNRVAFQIGGFAVYWYGVIIAVAFLAGILYVLGRVKLFGLDGDRVIDVILGGALGAIVGARLYYVIFTWDQFKDEPLRIITDFRDGGIAIYGAVIGGFLTGYLMCRWRRVRFLPMADLAVGGLILGQGIGRWGNFFNIEAFGGNTNLPWGMTSSSIAAYLRAHAGDLADLHMKVDPSLPVHPTFLYESVWCLLGFAVIALFTRRRRFDGELVLLYAAWYGAGRFVIEGLRTDSLLIGTIRVSQMLALLCVVASVLSWIAVRSTIRRSADPAYLMLYVDTEEGQSVLAGTFYEKKDPVPASDEEKAGADSDPAPGEEETGAQERGTAAQSGNKPESGENPPEDAQGAAGSEENADDPAGARSQEEEDTGKDESGGVQ